MSVIRLTLHPYDNARMESFKVPALTATIVRRKGLTIRVSGARNHIRKA